MMPSPRHHSSKLDDSALAAADGLSVVRVARPVEKLSDFSESLGVALSSDFYWP
jgi:hypothetical protein